MSNARTVMDDVNLATDTVDPGSADMEANEASPSGCLQEAAERVGIDLPGDVLVKLEDYCAALWEWNTKINLTRHTNFDLFARRDLLDSVKLAEQLSPYL